MTNDTRREFMLEHEHEHEHDHDDDDFGAGGMDWDDCFAILMEDRITTILDLPYRCLYCSTLVPPVRLPV